MCVKTDEKDIILEATDIDATIHGITGAKVEAESPNIDVSLYD